MIDSREGRAKAKAIRPLLVDAFIRGDFDKWQMYVNELHLILTLEKERRAMGYYVNPIDGSEKEIWLKENGVVASVSSIMNFNYDGNFLPVCLVENFAFTAAGIAYSPEERDIFIIPDGRPKTWFIVPAEKLTPFMGGLRFTKEVADDPEEDRSTHRPGT